MRNPKTGTEQGVPLGADVIDVLPAHRFDVTRLWDFLGTRLPDLGPRPIVRQFQSGHSNPTFLLRGEGHAYVLRKKPPGTLLPGAHAVEREYRVMKALQGSAVPVPTMRLLCEDPSVIGTPFFVMDAVGGRLVAEPSLPVLVHGDRRPAQQAMVTTLANLHAVDWRAVGLETFGKPRDYAARQVRTWTRQVAASRTDDMPGLDRLGSWLADHAPDNVRTTIVHGDFRAGNMILDATKPKIVAVIDWELSTLGHPLADLGYFLMPYHLPAGIEGVKGLEGLDLDLAGLASPDDLIDLYASVHGAVDLSTLTYFVGFSMFRLAAILQGVYKRARLGNASHADAGRVGQTAGLVADHGLKVIGTLR
ncbi:MAG: phosphotransferase family protein [Pseudomonadota bacterium]